MESTESTEVEQVGGTPADEGDFTGTGSGADGADNTALDGETFPAGDELGEESVPGTGPLGDTLAE